MSTKPKPKSRVKVRIAKDPVPSQIVDQLVPALNKRSTKMPEPNLNEIDQLVVTVILNSPKWVLIDRKVIGTKGDEGEGDSSNRYIALRRRGFEVSARHVGQVRGASVKNFWARWPHPLPELVPVPEFVGEDAIGYGGMA